MLNEYARDEDPFTKIGLRTVTVEVIYVVRTSNDSFEISWKERTYQGGASVKTDRFTGIANLVFKVPTTAETIGKNPPACFGMAGDPDPVEIRSCDVRPNGMTSCGSTWCNSWQTRWISW